jgi:CBS domain containing-hemolysin-like protein
MILSSTTVKEVTKTSLKRAFMLSSSATIDEHLLERILASRYSRIPVYKDNNKSHILGALLVKTLLPLAFTNPKVPPTVGSYHIREVLRVSEDSSLYDLYESFQSGLSNMAAVYNSKGVATGIVTLEDIFEKMHNASSDEEGDTSALQGEGRQRQMLELFQSMKGDRGSIRVSMGLS